MIATPEKNIVLSVEQQNHLNIYQHKLANLESEVVIAGKTLKGIKLETDRFVKERLFQEEQLSEINKKIEVVTQSVFTLTIDHDALQIELSLKKEQLKQTTEDIQVKESSLTEREKILSQQEEDHKKKIEDFNKKSSQLLEDQLSIQTAKDAFLKATETVTWLK